MVELLLLAGVVATALLLLVSAFLSSSETAIVTVSPEWRDSQASADVGRGRALDTLQEDSHRLLVTLFVGNNVVNIAISSITSVFDWVTRGINERISGEIDIERPYVE